MPARGPSQDGSAGKRAAQADPNESSAPAVQGYTCGVTKGARGMGAAAPLLAASVTTGRIRRGIALSVLLAALLAGPAGAACSSCCLSEPPRELALGSESCCGDNCAPILERAPADSIPAGLLRGCAAPTAVSAAAAPVLLPEFRSVSPSPAAFDLPPPPLLRLSPLRL
jgi:hypothetical protein